MTLINLSQSRSRGLLGPGNVFVLVTVTMLSGLALADRAAAWLIGEFPTSAILWELRFEYLRPIGVFYEFAQLSAGDLSADRFAGLVLLAAGFTGLAAMSQVRLLRAIAAHAVCAAAIVLWVCSLEYREGIYAPAGSPSTLYAMMGVLLALPSALLCIKIHAEYVGWDLASSVAMRRGKVAWRRARRRVEVAVVEFMSGEGDLLRGSVRMSAPLRITASDANRR